MQEQLATSRLQTGHPGCECQQVLLRVRQVAAAYQWGLTTWYSPRPVRFPVAMPAMPSATKSMGLRHSRRTRPHATVCHQQHITRSPVDIRARQCLRASKGQHVYSCLAPTDRCARISVGFRNFFNLTGFWKTQFFTQDSQ